MREQSGCVGALSSPRGAGRRRGDISGRVCIKYLILLYYYKHIVLPKLPVLRAVGLFRQNRLRLQGCRSGLVSPESSSEGRRRVPISPPQSNPVFAAASAAKTLNGFV